uniref:SDR family oxidoreductase n=1 Tax=Fundidesulfovibrio putealis TaxID=270496 RepID=A0A7C3WDF0_9BACT
MGALSLFDLSGRRAVVTGGGSGLGAAMAQALGEAGAELVLVSRRRDVLEQTAGQLREKGIRAGHLAGDLADLDAIGGLCRTILERFGRADILVNAAGANFRLPLADTTPAQWNVQIAINLSAPFFMAQGLAPAMAQAGWGRIINLGSLQSYRAFPDSAPYGAAKCGILQLTRAIAREWSPRGVTCNAIAPGFFPTALTAPVFANPEAARRNAEQTCIGRNGLPDDIHGLAIFLASNASSYITGQSIPLDGGFTSK